MTGDELLQFLREQRRIIDEEERRQGEVRRQHESNVVTADRAEEEAWTHLLALLVPDATPAALTRAGTNIGFGRSFGQLIEERVRHRAEKAARDRAAAEADPLFAARDVRASEIDIRLPEVSDLARLLRQTVEPLEREPEMLHLVAVGYGTARYAGRWWQLSYYNDWREGDGILERHGAARGITDFGALAAKFVEERDALRSLEQEERRLTTLKAALAELLARHAEATAALGSLEIWRLDTARAEARAHLASLPEEELFGLVSTAPDLLLAAKRLSGCRARQRYLLGLEQQWLRPVAADLQSRRDKVLTAEARIVGSQKKRMARYDDAETRRKYATPTDRWHSGWQRYDRAATTIVVFDRYEVVDPFASYVWWDVMTNGQVNGSFLDEVREHRMREARDEAAAATGDSAAGGLGFAGGMDAS